MLNEAIRTADQQVNAIRLNGSSQGLPIPIGWGKNRVPANLIWYGDFKATAKTTSQSGKGGVEQENTTYSYSAALMFALGFGTITGVTQVYREKAKYTPAALGWTVFTGTAGQTEWGYMTTNHSSEALRYMDIAYVAAGPYSLDSGGGIEAHSFEVNWRNAFGGPNSVVDALPSVIVSDFLTNSVYGALYPSSALGTLTQFGNYCAASGIFFSPVVTEQVDARETLLRWVEAANSEAFWSEGLLKITPYGDKSLTANGVTFTPANTVEYNLDTRHFLEPVKIVRKTVHDQFNVVAVEFLNRANDYNKDVVEAKDEASIALYGERRAPVLTCHFIVDAAVARIVAQLKLQRHQYVPNEYHVKLPWPFLRIEPMDILTLTDATIGLSAVTVNVIEAEWGEDYTMSLVCEDYPGEAGTAGSYSSASSGGYTPDYNAAPGNANAPVLFEPPLAFSGAPEVWVATSGGADWGGCEVWASYDNVNYRQVATLLGKSRHGVLSSTFASGSALDTTNTLAVNLSVSGGTLATVTQDEVDGLANPAWVDGEIICSKTATLTGANAYNLTYHKRGLYGTAIASHASTTKFVRLDEYVARVPYAVADIGKTIYIKLVSFNKYGGARQDISGVSPTTYTIVGAPPPVITNLQLAQPFVGTSAKAKWDTSAGATSYTVQVWQSGNLERTVTGLTQPQYEYTFEDAKADGGPWRALDIKVRADGPTGSSSYSTLSVSNSQAAAPTGVTATATASGVVVKTDPSTDTDFAGMVVHASTTSGFTPSGGNKVYEGKDIATPPLQLAPGSTHYIRVAHFDQFGQSGLNYAAEVSVTPQRAVLVVTSLPGSANVDDCVLLTTTMTLYRWNGSAWV